MGKLVMTKLTDHYCDICDDSKTPAVIEISGGGAWAPTLSLCDEHSRELLIKLGELLKSKKGVKSK